MADLGDSPTLNPMQGYGDALGLGPGWRPTPAGNGLVTITLPTGQRVTVNAQNAPQFAGFLGTLGGGGAPLGNIGGYNYRNIAGTHTLSKHASGNAVDIGDQSGRDIVSPEFRDWYNNNQPLVRRAMAQNGIASGGDWRNPDLGHFEIGRPLSGPQQSYAMASNLQGSGDGNSGQAGREQSNYNSTPYNPGPQGTVMNTGAPTQNSGEIVGQGTRGWNIYQTTPTWTGSPLSQAPEARDEGDFRAQQPAVSGPQNPLLQRQAQIRQLILQNAMANIPHGYQFKLG